MKKRTKIATVVFIAFAVSISLVWATKTLLTIPTSGNVPESGLDSVPASIEWGNMTKGVPVLKLLSITNTGDIDVPNLNMTYTLPPSFVGTLTWDIEGQTILVGETKMATLILTLTDMPEGPFSFDININGDV